MPEENASIITSLTIGGYEIPVENTEMLQSTLNFYPENPRIYSLFDFEVGVPTQEEIEEKIMELDHINQLVQSIRENGGLVDPIIVKGTDNIVLEGNSRLAAYRKLAKKEPLKWAKIKCLVLPTDIDQNLILTLLGQYHIIGKKDWSPYEQAGYLWRRNKRYGVSVDSLSKEVGLGASNISQLIGTYDFMQVNGDRQTQHWSHYYEYLKSNNIKKIRDKYLGLDNRVVNQIIKGEINAVDIRDKLSKLSKLNGQKGKNIITDYIEEKTGVIAAFEQAEILGVTNRHFQTLYKFRLYLAINETKTAILKQDKDSLAKCKFELKKIIEAAEYILKNKLGTQ